MEAYSLGRGISSSLLDGAVLFRAMRGRYLSQFPFFYSYLGYVFFGSATAYYLVLQFWPQYYASVFWFYFLVSLLAEFAVLVEISDRIFNPYPAVRKLGRFATFCICLTFLSLYVLPTLVEPQSSALAILDLVKRTSLTKAVIILALLAAAYHYRLPLGKNISGMMLGFSLDLAVNVVNFALARRMGRAFTAGRSVSSDL
jgi:hypothetical protein